MIKTHHLQQRQKQRNISDDMIKVAIKYGTLNNSAYILSKNTAIKLMIEYNKKMIVFAQSSQAKIIETMINNVKEIIKLNGLVVIKREGVIITAFAHRTT